MKTITSLFLSFCALVIGNATETANPTAEGLAQLAICSVVTFNARLY